MATAEYKKAGKRTLLYTCTGAVAVKEIKVFGAAGNVTVGVAQAAGVTGDIITFDVEGEYIFGAALTKPGTMEFYGKVSTARFLYYEQ